MNGLHRRRPVRMIRRYISIHGPLLAKGLSFSALFATVPLLFLLSVAGSLALTPEVRQLLEQQLLGALGAGARQSIVSSMERLASRPGSLGALSIGLFLWSVHQLFFDIHRVVRAALDLPVSPARGRARAMVVNGVVLLLLYAVAVVNLAARVIEPWLPAGLAAIRLVTTAGTILLLMLVLWTIIRLAGGVRLGWRLPLVPVATAAFVWLGASSGASALVQAAGRRVIVYGVLASAILFLMLMRVYAEIILHTSLWIHDRQEYGGWLLGDPNTADTGAPETEAAEAEAVDHRRAEAGAGPAEPGAARAGDTAAPASNTGARMGYADSSSGRPAGEDRAG